MPNYHLTYSGPNHMPETDEEMAAMMSAWERWFGQLGEALIDSGAPFGARQTIDTDGTVTDGGPSNGYSIIKAENLSDAIDKARTCPVLSLGDGNTVEVSEQMAM